MMKIEYTPSTTDVRSMQTSMVEQVHKLIEQVASPKDRGRFKSAVIEAGRDSDKLLALKRSIEINIDMKPAKKCKTPAQRKQEREQRHKNSKNPRATTEVAPKSKKIRKLRNKTERKMRPDEIAAARKAIEAHDAKIAAMKPGYTPCSMGNIRRVTGRFHKPDSLAA